MSTLDDLAHVIDRIPFLGTMRSDLSQLRRILADRRAPRVLAIGAPGSGRTTLANELLSAAALPTQGDGQRASVIAPEAQWVHVRALGRSLDWLELDAGPLEGERLRRLEQALAEARPDVIVLVLGPADDVARVAESVRAVRTLAGDEPAIGTFAVASHAPARTAGDKIAPELEERLAELRRLLLAAKVEVPMPLPFAMAAATGVEADLTTLADELYVRMPDAAQVEAARAFPVSRDKKREIARLLVQRASTIAVTIGLAPVPFSDAVLLVPLQSLMVTAIAYIAGQPWDARAAAEWLGSVGVLGATAFGLRWGAQQLVKLMPGAGTLLSASVAGTGTLAIGRSAMAYFIDGPGLRRPKALLPATAS